MIVALSGCICAIQTIVTGIPFMIVCAVIFGVIWVVFVLDWFRDKCPEKLADVIYNKLKK